MKISVFGLGYVGAVSAACLARLGHQVTGIDPVDQKVGLVNSGRSPIAEPGLDDLMAAAVKGGALRASTSADGVQGADAVFVCVGTPSLPNGDVDTRAVVKVAREIAERLRPDGSGTTVVFRSTVPPGTMSSLVVPVFDEVFEAPAARPRIVYHPEFLREGSAIADFFEAPQVVAASCDGRLDASGMRGFFEAVYAGVAIDFRFVRPRTAEMIKYVNNTFHALKVAWANEIGRVGRAHGIDVAELMELFLSDTKLNVSRAYLRPGFAYGGSCLPKDLRGLNRLARKADVDVPILEHIDASNRAHIREALELILASGARRVGFLGLAFKAGTDDVRESPLLYLAEQCIGKGIGVRIAEPSIDLATLTGRNLEFLRAHLEHIRERLLPSAADAVTFGEVIVLGHADASFVELLQQHPGKRILDLTGRPVPPSLAERTISIAGTDPPPDRGATEKPVGV